MFVQRLESLLQRIHQLEKRVTNARIRNSIKSPKREEHGKECSVFLLLANNTPGSRMFRIVGTNDS